MYDSLGGGTVFAKKYIKASDSSPSPITIFRTVTIECPGLDDAASLFANYVFEDVKNATTTEEETQVFQDFQIIDITSQGTGIKKKKYQIEEILEKKSEFITDMKNAAKNKRLIKLKMIARIPNPEAEFEGIMMGDAGEKAMPEEIKYVFIVYNKFYGLHYIQKTPSALVRTSYWHLPCVAYLEVK